MDNHFPSINVRAVEAETNVVGKSHIKTSVVNHSHSQTLDGSFSSHGIHIDHAKESAQILAGDLDDDDILEVIYATVFYQSELDWILVILN